MKYLQYISIITLMLTIHSASAQTDSCAVIYEYPDTEASFKKGHDLIQFFNENILEIIYDPESSDFPPSSFKMIIIINDRDEVVSISNLRGDYSDETKHQILAVLQKEKGWRSGEVNGEKVCSEFYFIIGCIMWH